MCLHCWLLFDTLSRSLKALFHDIILTRFFAFSLKYFLSSFSPTSTSGYFAYFVWLLVCWGFFFPFILIALYLVLCCFLFLGKLLTLNHHYFNTINFYLFSVPTTRIRVLQGDIWSFDSVVADGSSCLYLYGIDERVIFSASWKVLSSFTLQFDFYYKLWITTSCPRFIDLLNHQSVHGWNNKLDEQSYNI